MRGARLVDAVGCLAPVRGPRLFIAALLLLSNACGSSADKPTPLRYPVCEPSAALVVPCIDHSGRCLLVGDNETADAVFLYPIGEEGLDVDGMRVISLGKNEVSDIESMAKLDYKTLLLIGSHSRNGACAIKDKRRRMILLRNWGQGRAVEGSTYRASELSASVLPGGSATSGPVLKAVGEAIDQAEARAAEAAMSKAQSACEAAAAFNIEGAVAIPGAAGDSKVWIGLRSPVVTYAGKTWAVLLRLERPDALVFDQALLLDLAGRGVRELARDDGWLWGIAGGPGDAEKNFVLWKVELEDLRPDAQLHPHIIRSLPSSSEGLAFVGGQALVLIDGDKGKDGSAASCETPGAYLVIKRLPGF